MDGPHPGCAWSPEHRPESRWPRDLALMREVGFTVMRVAEFAWSRLEPRQGHFELDWLERAVDAAGAHGPRVVIGTPTGAPPAWLSAAYPEILPAAEHGARAAHGRRGHVTVGNPGYRRLCREIVGTLAERFGRHPAVIGWQLDHGCAGSPYHTETQARFQACLRARYDTLEVLNARWVTACWSQEYGDWSHVPLPRRAPGEAPQHHSLVLAWRRFVAEQYRSCFGAQLASTHAHAGAGRWITHKVFNNATLDRHALAQELDLAAADGYVGEGDLQPLQPGFDLELARGLKRRNFWPMKTQPGHANWARVNDDLPPGGVRALVRHAAGHGANAVLFWQWRPVRGGQEQEYGSLPAPDGQPREAAPLLSGERPRVALLDATEDRWALDAQRHHQEFDPLEHLRSYYRAVGLTVDVVHLSAPLDSYALVVAPQLHQLDETLAGRLAAFGRNGHLVLGPRNGVWREASARRWGERLRVSAPDAEVLLRCGRACGGLVHQPAAVTRPLGRGRVSLLGTWLDPAGMHAATRWMPAASGPTLTEGTELRRRVGPHHQVLIVLNHADDPCEVPLPYRGRAAHAGATTLALAARVASPLARSLSPTQRSAAQKERAS